MFGSRTSGFHRSGTLNALAGASAQLAMKFKSSACRNKKFGERVFEPHAAWGSRPNSGSARAIADQTKRELRLVQEAAIASAIEAYAQSPQLCVSRSP